MAKKKTTKKEAKWVPICKIASAYDFNEETGMYEQSMSPIELFQNDQTKEIVAKVIPT
jgi:hypothetical protein